MAGVIGRTVRRPPAGLVERFGRVPTTILSDMMNRMNAMHAAIKPVRPGAQLVGPAVTVKTMVGDNLMTHRAIYEAQAGDVLVIDGRGHLETAIWGNIQTIASRLRRLGGVVVDGAVRDVAELRRADVPVFARGATPAGPHKGWGGNLNEPVQCGGVSVSPGDIVVGDDDGVVVIPQRQAREILRRALARLDEERQWRARLEAGDRTLEVLGLEEKLKHSGDEHGRRRRRPRPAGLLKR